MADIQFSFATHISPIEVSFSQTDKLNQEQSSQIPTKQIKTSEEIEMERIQQVKKAQSKDKLKQKRLYNKILKQQQQQNLLSQEIYHTDVKKKTSYVQALINKSKIQLENNKDFKMQQSLKKKTKKRKRTLTVSTPFELKTSKRVRLDLMNEDQKHEQYEPLWSKIQKSFKLRDGEDTQMSQDYNRKQLTRPKSPTLQTNQRMKLKDELSNASADRAHNLSDFKARPFNRKIFESESKLPQIEKKIQTSFEEFRLSKSNAKIGKKTFIDYVNNKENSSMNLFRAKSYDRKLFQAMPTPKTDYKRKLTQFSPFNLKTEERNTLKQSLFSEQGNSCSNSFKAREMPKYNFFQVKHEQPKKILFQEFQLTTRHRSNSKKRSNSQDQESEVKFQALPMPNFDKLKPKTCKRSQVTFQTKNEPFSLSTDIRGQEKTTKFQQQLSQAMQSALEQTHFKAREFKIKFFEGTQHHRSTTEASSKPVEIKLHSIERSKMREEFNLKIKEKEKELLIQEERKKELQLQQEQEEIKRIRDQMTFKAQQVKKFKGVDGAKVSEKVLTIPVAPKLHTADRAQLKDDTTMN